MKERNTILISVILGWMMALTMPVFAQVDNTATDTLDGPSRSLYNFTVVARSYGDSIVLRWAPEDAGVWRLASNYGWNIYRIKTEAESEANPADTSIEILLTPTRSKP